MNKLIRYVLFTASLILFINCSEPSNLVIMKQITGPNTNCYLIYDDKSKEAAIFDVAGPIDSLITTINEKNLNLKYFFFSHGHFDHVMGLPPLRKEFPDAMVCINQDDYKDMQVQLDWVLKNLDAELIEYIKEGIETRKMLEFDASTFGIPDIYLKDSQVFELGNFKIKALHTPGHSLGSTCFQVDSYLFSGDVLFYRSAGRTDVQNSSREDQIKSIRRLYEIFPDETIVYPAHGQSTDIGSEKKFNKKIALKGGEWLEN